MFMSLDEGVSRGRWRSERFRDVCRGVVGMMGGFGFLAGVVEGEGGFGLLGLSVERVAGCRLLGLSVERADAFQLLAIYDKKNGNKKEKIK